MKLEILKLESMAFGGEAIARDESGRVVFVPYGIAGETVRVEIVAEKKNFARGRIVEIVNASPYRVKARCAHFGDCGGCQWQHIAYDAQLQFKTQIVRVQFARIGKMPDAIVRETIGMREPWRYRNNAQFVCDDAGRLCFRAFESNALVRIKECHIIHPLLDEMFHSLELDGAGFSGVTLRAGANTNQKMIMLESPDNAPPEIEMDEPASIAFQVPSGETVALIGNEKLSERLRDREFAFSPTSFFQVNTEMAEQLVALVEKYLAPRATDILLDAYGGVGVFGLMLAARVARVIEIEENPRAVKDARANAANISNIEFHVGAVEKILPRIESRIDLVVADPPRAGMDARVIDALIAQKPRAIAYVSCDPATLARDARKLVDGGFVLREVQPVDMFPQTYHIECVAWFETRISP
ncbi:MAG: 23S rRNA (uracil(1939)-C(5))-methyltransferase RlmD [Chloroflexi bacterium]|nr:23S rRNA (uracil(1939)-C(5))-methyltransferase RlmD [Chloroflexota bacterium]